jgi:hypothetical protein
LSSSEILNYNSEKISGDYLTTAVEGVKDMDVTSKPSSRKL